MTPILLLFLLTSSPVGGLSPPLSSSTGKPPSAAFREARFLGLNAGPAFFAGAGIVAHEPAIAATPLLASASKKQLDKRERAGKEKQEKEGIVKGLFEGGAAEAGDEESVVSELAPLATLKLVTQDEWDRAPRLVKMQAKIEPLNEAVSRFNDWFGKNLNKEEVEEAAAMDLSGKRMILMGLAHFGRLVMGEKDGKKVYRAAS